MRILAAQGLKLIKQQSSSTSLYFDKDLNSSITQMKKDRSRDVRLELEDVPTLEDEESVEEEQKS